MEGKVEVVVQLWQGILNELAVYKDDENRTAESKSLELLSRCIGETFATVEEFDAWQEGNRDDDYTYLWWGTTVE